MLRRYLPAIISSLLFIALGIILGLTWWGATGRTDMPWWLAVLLVAAAALISDLAEQTLRHHRCRTGEARHRRTAL
ncbi:hypothetical protein HUT11_35500 (plasmid) [Streptomyces seoulensis]|nr:hypothetical protein HUT11_35500 [Streptomyces seoulensis]